MNLTDTQRGAILYPALFVFAFLFVFAAINRAGSIYDEGLILTGAMRVANGEIPHRDFYANYGPAQFYVVALTDHRGFQSRASVVESGETRIMGDWLTNLKALFRPAPDAGLRPDKSERASAPQP